MGVNRKKRSFGAVLFTLLALVAAAALLISYLALFFNPTEYRIPMFFGLYYIPILLLNLLLLLIALIKHRQALLIPFVALIPTLFLADRFVKFGREETRFEVDAVKVLTYNVGRYSAGGRKVTHNESIQEIKKFLAEQDADIVCLQEFAVVNMDALSPYIPEYPYKAKHLFKGNRYFGNITLSKYPIRKSRALTFPESRNLSLVTDIEVKGRTIRVYNCHLESYALSFTALIKRLFRKSHFTEEMTQVHERMRDATARRSAQVDSLLNDEAQSSLPCMLCGDFNDTPISYTYHRLVKRKSDSFVEAGTGFSSTYSVMWPMLRVDYILFPQEYAAGEHTVYRVPWSDHYPVTTMIYLDNQQE